jgi:hypothetical protein
MHWAQSTRINYHNLAIRWQQFATAHNLDPWADSTICRFVESTKPLPSAKLSYLKIARAVVAAKAKLEDGVAAVRVPRAPPR